MKPYTDEELSRILGEHAAGNLDIYGSSDWGHGWEECDYPTGCANQAAYNEPSPILAEGLNQEKADSFDAFYSPEMTPEDLLKLLRDRR